MYAVVRTGGKQYKVSQGVLLNVERLEGEAGDVINLGEVLLLANGEQISIGSPVVAGASVKAEIIAHPRGEKKIIFKKNRRHGKQLTKGHRQELTRVKITEISA